MSEGSGLICVGVHACLHCLIDRNNSNVNKTAIKPYFGWTRPVDKGRKSLFDRHSSFC